MQSNFIGRVGSIRVGSKHPATRETFVSPVLKLGKNSQIWSLYEPFISWDMFGFGTTLNMQSLRVDSLFSCKEYCRCRLAKPSTVLPVSFGCYCCSISKVFSTLLWSKMTFSPWTLKLIGSGRGKEGARSFRSWIYYFYISLIWVTILLMVSQLLALRKVDRNGQYVWCAKSWLF